MREADISVRLTVPEQHELVVRRIGNVAFACPRTYLKARGDLAMDVPGCAPL